MSKIEEIMEQLQTLTLLEAAELVEKIEETFDVDAYAGGGMVMIPGAGSGGDAAEAAEEKTEFDLFLVDVPADKKITILKIVRSITGLGLKEAKDLVEAAPSMVKEAVPETEANEIKAKLEEAGATVEIK
jgi:large subunit ribosomal protein L7/L12